MTLAEYTNKHAVRGACTCGLCIDAPPNPEEKQPQGHTADLVFFKVAQATEKGNTETFRALVEQEFPHWLDGNDHSYLELGADIGSQGLAMMAMGLGSLLGVWELHTPESIMPFLDRDTKLMMAQNGMVSIKAQGE